MMAPLHLDPASQQLADLMHWFGDEGCIGTTFGSLQERTHFIENIRWWASTDIAPGVKLIVEVDAKGKKFKSPVDAMLALKQKYLDSFEGEEA